MSTHVLDLVSGRPAPGMRVVLRRLSPGPELTASAVTNADGRTDAPLLQGPEMKAGTYQLEFHVGDYFGQKAAGSVPFLGVVPVRFVVADPSASYHVPLLVTPWAYNTYRGS
ncbi:MAG TPA: hydroxyisourate hydrolase [Opitutaceae bacterium]